VSGTRGCTTTLRATVRARAPSVLEVADKTERHIRLGLAETSPADKATIAIEDFGVKFLAEHAVEPNSKMTYAQLLRSHIYPYIGKRRVAEISRETIHRLLTVVLPEGDVSQATVINVRTCLSALMQMAWDHGYRSDNPVNRGTGLDRPAAERQAVPAWHAGRLRDGQVPL
jgi:hypothetical protein